MIWALLGGPYFVLICPGVGNACLCQISVDPFSGKTVRSRARGQIRL